MEGMYLLGNKKCLDCGDSKFYPISLGYAICRSCDAIYSSHSFLGNSGLHKIKSMETEDRGKIKVLMEEILKVKMLAKELFGIGYKTIKYCPACEEEQDQNYGPDFCSNDGRKLKEKTLKKEQFEQYWHKSIIEAFSNVDIDTVSDILKVRLAEKCDWKEGIEKQKK